MLEYARVNALAARQHGLITRWQLIEVGISPRSVSHLVKAGKLHRVRWGVYRVCGSPLTWRSTALAAVLSAGPDSVLSHCSAAALWGLLDHHDLTTIELTLPTPCRQPGITAHRRSLDARDKTFHDHIPVTTPARTLIDLAARLGEARLGKVVDEALRRGLTTLPKLSAALARVPSGASTGRTRAAVGGVLGLRGAGYDPGANDWEIQMDLWFDRAGLPEAKRQHRVQVDGHRYTLDRAIPELKVGIEWTGRGSHGTRSQFEYDSDRRSRLQAAGWRILDFHYRSPLDFIARTVLAVCEEQRRLLRSTDEITPMGA